MRYLKTFESSWLDGKDKDYDFDIETIKEILSDLTDSHYRASIQTHFLNKKFKSLLIYTKI